MMWPFRRAQTPPEDPSRHQITLDLIEQVAALRGQVRAMETEWDDIRVQIRKGYQRLEKAYQRLEAADLEEPESKPPAKPVPELKGFAKKLHEMKGA